MKRPSYVDSVGEDRPRTVYLYATSHCNSNCSYCVFRYSNKELPRVHLSLDTIIDTWENSELLENCGVVVQGGEFTLHPEALEIMKYLRSVSPKLTLLTNAVDVELARPLIEYATQVTISLDGPSHDKARGVPGNLASVLRMLSLLDHKEIPTTLQMTIGPWNAKDVAQGTENVLWFIDTCMLYNCQPRFNIASDDGLLGAAHYKQNQETLIEISNGIRLLATQRAYEKISKSLISGAKYIAAASNKKAGNFIPCFSTSIYTTIGEDGSVWLCQGLSKEEAVIGNIHENGFDEIWNSASSDRKEFRTCQACTLSCQLTGDLAYMQNSGRV